MISPEQLLDESRVRCSCLLLAIAALALSAQGQITLECMQPGSLGKVVVDEGKPSEIAKMRSAPQLVTRQGKHLLLVHWEKRVQPFKDVAPYMEGEIAGVAWTYCGYSATLGLHAIQKNGEDKNSGVLLDERTGSILPGGFSVSFSPDLKSYITFDIQDGEDFSNLTLYSRSGALIWRGFDGIVDAQDQELTPEFDKVYWSHAGKLMAEYLDQNKKVVLVLTEVRKGNWKWVQTTP